MSSSPNPFVLGQPGYRDAIYATPKYVFTSPADQQFLPGGKWIDGAKSRDTSNTNYTDRLQSGVVMGKVAVTGLYANSFFGQNTVAYDGSTTFTIGVAEAVELVRRIGSTGSMTVTGPPAAAGVVRSLSLTYSAVNQSTGAVTVTAAAVNEVQTVTTDVIVSGGSVNFLWTKSDGSQQLTETAYNTSWTQTVADIQTAANAFLGTSAVALAVAATKNMTITFSGTGYAGLPQTLVVADYSAATGPTVVSVVKTTAGVAGAFAAGSVVGQADGSQAPLTFIPGPYPIAVTDNAGNVAKRGFPEFPVGGQIDETRLIGYSAMDSSLQTWLKQQLSTALGGKYVFKGTF